MKPTYEIDSARKTMTVALDGCDEAKALEVCTLARDHYLSWEQSEYTEWSDFDELVDGAAKALGMKDICEKYAERAEDDLSSLFIDYESMPEATAMRGCAAILSAQYRNGLNADVGVVNETIHDECLPVAERAAAPAI